MKNIFVYARMVDIQYELEIILEHSKRRKRYPNNRRRKIKANRAIEVIKMVSKAFSILAELEILKAQSKMNSLAIVGEGSIFHEIPPQEILIDWEKADDKINLKKT